MSFHIETIEPPNLLHLRSTGEWNLETGPRIIEEIASLFQASPHDKLLLDCRGMELDTSVSVDYDQASLLAELCVGSIHKIAAIVQAKDAYFNDFFETVAVNRGLNLKLFIDEQQAIKWLTDNDSGD